MQRARFKMFGLALLALGLASGCGTNGTGTKKGDGGSADGGDTGETTRGSNGKDAGGDKGGGKDAGETNGESTNGGTMDAGPDASGTTGDAGPCVPKYFGCDDKYPDVDPTTLCGEIDDGCGNTIQCDPNGTNCSGFDVACNDPSKPNQCGCAVAACEDVVSGGAECGAPSTCGMTIDCGTCDGAQDVCTEGFKCECAANLQACDGKVCGTRPDGCGNNVPCGSNAGVCAVGDCAVDQTKCTCPSKAAACGSSTGPLTLPNGCTYDCNASCVADNATACAGAQCGTATNNCGDVVSCGANAGGCAVGSTCVDTTFVVGSAVPARSGSYLGGLCVDNDVANLMGKYAVRTHAFRRGGNSSTSSLSRAEALSLVDVVLQSSSGKLQMTDYGCAAKTTSEPGGLNVVSVAPSYANLLPVSIELTVTGNASGTGTWVRPIVSTPTGFTRGVPAYCVGFEGMKVSLPAGDSRRDKWFTNNQCTCPTPGIANAKPATSNGAPSQDCRITDADADGDAGFTILATAAPLATGTRLYNATISEITWSGGVVPSGYHTAVAIEPSPIQRSLVGCDPMGFFGQTLCDTAQGTAGGTFDCACGVGGEYNFIQFVPIEGVAAPGGTWDCADISSQAATLFVSYGTCANTTECPAGAICKGNACWPATTGGACVSGDDTCPSDMVCRTDNACWPPTSGAENKCANDPTCTMF